MNDAWKNADADAHAAKADALSFAIGVLDGIEPILDAIEQPQIRNCKALIERARERHNEAAALGRAA